MRGALNREGERAQVAGDLDDGEFTLEESADGSDIAAVWLGDVVEGSCGREIRGTWKADGDPRQFQFVLRKQAGLEPPGHHMASSRSAFRRISPRLTLLLNASMFAAIRR